jgi:hypothetical protein
VTWTVGQEVAIVRSGRIVGRGTVEAVHKTGGCVAMGQRWTLGGNQHRAPAMLRDIKSREARAALARGGASLDTLKGRVRFAVSAALSDAETREDVQAIADALGGDPVTQPTEHPALFSGPLVRAILDGTMTQARRPVTMRTASLGSTPAGIAASRAWRAFDLSIAWADAGGYLHIPCPASATVHRAYPRVSAGDRLWVRETWRPTGLLWDAKPSKTRACSKFEYRADGDGPAYPRWRPSILMPRWANRLTLDVLVVRPQLVADITDDEAIRDGVVSHRDGWWHLPGGVPETCPSWAFRSWWDATYPGQPWCWVYEFEATP